MGLIYCALELLPVLSIRAGRAVRISLLRGGLARTVTVCRCDRLGVFGYRCCVLIAAHALWSPVRIIYTLRGARLRGGRLCAASLNASPLCRRFTRCWSLALGCPVLLRRSTHRAGPLALRSRLRLAGLGCGTALCRRGSRASGLRIHCRRGAALAALRNCHSAAHQRDRC